MPEAGIAASMRHVHGGLGSITVVLRIAIAATVSWVASQYLSQSTLGVFAPMTTLMVVQASPSSTIGLAFQRILGAGLGVLGASIWVNAVGLTWWSFLVAVLLSLLVARRLPWSIIGQLQLPVAVVFVLTLGPGTLEQDVWRVLDVLIGGLVGVAVITIYPPRPKAEPFEQALRELRDELLATLDRIGTECGSFPSSLGAGAKHDFIVSSRSLRDRGDAVRDAFAALASAAQWNLRGRAVRERLDDEAWRLRRVMTIGMQVRGIASAADALYDRDEPPAMRPDELRRITDQVAWLGRTALGGPGDDVRTSDAGVVQAEAAMVAASITALADELEARSPRVSAVLGSLSLLGRLDHLARLLGRFAAGRQGTGPSALATDDDDADDEDARLP